MSSPAPSLLSRLSPAPSSHPSSRQNGDLHEIPPHLRGAPAAAADALSSSPPATLKPATSPSLRQNGFAAPHLNGHAGQTARPIPARRPSSSSGINGASWRASASPPVAMARSPPLVRAGTSPLLAGKSSSPSSPRSGSALDQIEAMLSQLRTQKEATASPPAGKPASLPRSNSTSTFSPPKPVRSTNGVYRPPIPSSPSPSAPSSAVPKPAPSPAAAAQAQAPKKQILGGRSKWARAGDAEADDYASVAEKEAAQREEGKAAPASTPQPAAKKEELVPPIPVVAPSPAPSPQLPSPTATPSASVFSTSTSHPTSHSVGGHIDWADADDDDDTLPTLDDWGVETAAEGGEELAPFEADPEPALPAAAPAPAPAPAPVPAVNAWARKPVVSPATPSSTASPSPAAHPSIAPEPALEPQPEKERQRLRISSAAATRVISHALSGNNRIPLREPQPLRNAQAGPAAVARDPPPHAKAAPTAAPVRDHPPHANVKGPPAPAPPALAAPSPAPQPSPTKKTGAAIPPPSSRLFAAARAAALSSNAEAALSLSVSPPRTTATAPPAALGWASPPEEKQPKEQDKASEPRQRKPTAPAGALFSRLSGLSASRPPSSSPSSPAPPAPAAPAPARAAQSAAQQEKEQVHAPEDDGVGWAEAPKKRKPRAGKGRGGAHAYAAPPPPAAAVGKPPPPHVAAMSKPPLASSAAPAAQKSFVANSSRGGGGTQTSKWA
ncbi:hypothetical protein JCM10213_008786 [Rhodosporidiobolus nylandii]